MGGGRVGRDGRREWCQVTCLVASVNHLTVFISQNLE